MKPKSFLAAVEITILIFWAVILTYLLVTGYLWDGWNSP